MNGISNRRRGLMRVSGRAADALALLLVNQLTSYQITTPAIKDYAFYNASALTSVTFPAELTGSIGAYAFFGAGVRTIHAHRIYSVGQCGFQTNALKTIVIEYVTKTPDNMTCPIGLQAFRGNNLEVIDFGHIAGFNRAQLFMGQTNLKTMILRDTSCVSLSNVDVFASSPFASGGSGGTIYIPEALYDHLGDGTVYDYKAAANWSTLDGCGTITWAKIEGSAYDGCWADGTPISE